MSKHGNSSLISTTSKGRPSKKVRLRRKRKKTEDTQIESVDGVQPNQVQLKLGRLMWHYYCETETISQTNAPFIYLTERPTG